MAQGWLPSHTIISSGNQCVDPHHEGSGPIKANSSIIFDIFPRSQHNGYFGDLSRTVVRGRASDKIKAIYATVQAGQKIGYEQIRDGVNGKEVHQNILNMFAARGFPTGKINGRMQGFFHGTGHGLGLDIHSRRASRPSTRSYAPVTLSRGTGALLSRRRRRPARRRRGRHRQGQSQFNQLPAVSGDLSYVSGCLDPSHRENTKLRIDRGVTLEERRHQREYFSSCSALGTMVDLFTNNLTGSSPRSRLQGRKALPSFRKSCTSIAATP